MAVVAGGTARAAQIADELALLDGLARADGQGQAVRIHRAVSTAVVDDDRVAIARTCTGLVVTRLGDGTACGGVDGRTGRGADVHALVASAVPARAVAVVRHRPDELAAAGDVLGAGSHLLGAFDHLLVHRLLDDLGGKHALVHKDILGVVDVLEGHTAQTVLALLEHLGGSLRIFVGFCRLRGECDFFLTGLDAGDAHLKASLFFGDDEVVALKDAGRLAQRLTLERRVEGAQLTEGQVIVMCDGPESVARLDGVDLLGLLHAHQLLSDGLKILQAFLEVEAVFQRDLLVEAHAHIGVVLFFLVGVEHGGEVIPQRFAVAAHRRQLAVQIKSRAFADLVAGALDDGVCHLVFVHHVVGNGEGVARLDGPLGLVGAGVADTLHHVLAGRVEDVLIRHIAHGFAVDPDGQRIRLVDDILEHCCAQRQCADGQGIHRHAGQQTEVAADAVFEVVDAGLKCCTEALLPADAVGMDEKGHDALCKQHDGAKQVFNHLCCAGERRLRQSLCKAADASSNPESGVLDGTPHPHGSILRAKAQRVERCANAQYQLRRAQLPGGIVQPVSAAAIPPVAAQQMDALELRPKRAQLCAEAGVPRRTGWLVLPRFSCFIFQQKGCSFLYFQEILICLFSLLSTCCRIRTAFLTRITLFIIHPASAETSIDTKFGLSFHLLFTKYTNLDKKLCHILRQRAFHCHRPQGRLVHRYFDADAVRHPLAARHPERLFCAVERLPPDARPAPAVEVISGQRVADGCKMYPYLVGPARHRDAGREAQAVLGFQYGIFRPAGFAIGGDAPPDDTLPLPPDGGVDDARPEGKFSFCNGVVELFHPLSQQRGGVAILGRQHEAAGVLVDAVHRAEDGASTLTQRPGGIAVRQRIQRVIQGWMHCEMGRLFHHEGKSVLVDHIHRDVVLRHNALPLRRQFKGDDLPGLHPAVGQDGGTVGKKAVAPEFHGPGQVGGDTALAQKTTQQHPIRLGRDFEIKLHLPTSSAGNI